MPISMTSNGTKYYLHYDQVGTLRAVTDTNHNIIKEITYDTFGNILLDTNLNFKVPFGFAGGDTNLYGYVLGDPVNFIDPVGLADWSLTKPGLVPDKIHDLLPLLPGILDPIEIPGTSAIPGNFYLDGDISNFDFKDGIYFDYDVKVCYEYKY